MKADELQNKLGRVIRYHRERLGYSQESFANHISLQRAYYGSVERGKQNLTLRTLHQIADGLNSTPACLLDDTETMSDKDFPPPRRPGRPPGSRQRG